MLFKRSAIALVLLVLLVGLMAASASAANANTARKPGDDGVIITHEKGLSPGTIMPMSVSGSIMQGEVDWWSRGLWGYQTDMYIALYWGNPSNSLRMRIYSPDGYVYGPFYDNCDGKLDGFIPCHLHRSYGLPQGTYYVEIYGDRVYGIQSYTLY